MICLLFQVEFPWIWKISGNFALRYTDKITHFIEENLIMQDIILAISGKPGLYKLVSRGNRTLIVETLDNAHRRFPAGMQDRVTSLGDVSMYTDSEDVNLMQVFQNLYNAEQSATQVSHKEASESQLIEIMDKALPNWDRDRVHFSDIRKLIQWYNILVGAGYTVFAAQAPSNEMTVAEGAEEAAAPAESEEA